MDEIELDFAGRRRRAASVQLDDGARIERYGTEHPDTFAGHWVQPDGAHVVAFTADIDEHRMALASLLYHPELITLVRFRYTYRYLLELTDRIPALVGLDVLAVWGPDTKANKVRVVVLPDHLDRVRESLRQTNPDDVYVEAGGRPIRA